MHATATPTEPPRQRLARLQGYLQEDPRNGALLAEAFDAAVSAGCHPEAEQILAAACTLDLEAPEWLFRRSRLCIARRQLGQAAALLQRLQVAQGPLPVLLHDRGYVHLLAGEPQACLALIEPLLDQQLPPELQGPTQLLWLRAQHHLHEVDRAWAWARQRLQTGDLQPAAQGVASLVAIDADDFGAARELADAALAADPTQVEALVARATVALAEGDADATTRALQRALHHQPEDGRAWSMLGLASLQARELPKAHAALERASRAIPGHIGTWHALGWTRLLLGDRGGAAIAFDHALALDRNFAESHGAVGLLLALAGERERAAHHLAAAQKLDPDNVTGRFAQALLQGDAADAARLQALASRLLDRPGFLGRTLAESLRRSKPPP